jgi:polar amino acid transport system substrate-binding protein
MKQKIVLFMAIVVIVSLCVSACGQAAQPTAPATEPPSEPTVEPTAPPTEAPSEPTAEGGVVPPAPGESPTVDAIRQAGKLRAGIAVALPWLGQDPQTGEFFGPSIEIGEWIAEGLGVELELVESNWDVIVAGLQANKFEVAIAPLNPTPERREVADFVGYLEAGLCHMVLKDNDKIQTLEDLNRPDVVWCQYTGGGTLQAVQAKYPDAQYDTIVAPPGGEARIEEVLAGRCDATTIDSPLIIVYQQEFPQIKVLPESAEYCSVHPDLPAPVSMALSKGDEAFKAYLEDVVEAHRDEIDASYIMYSAPEYLRPPE